MSRLTFLYQVMVVIPCFIKNNVCFFCQWQRFIEPGTVLGSSAESSAPYWAYRLPPEVLEREPNGSAQGPFP